MMNILCHYSRCSSVLHMVWSWFLLVYSCVSSTSLCVHAPIQPASHVRVKNVAFLQSKLSPEEALLSSAGFCSSLIILHSKCYRSGASEASGEEDSLVPIAGDPNRGWGLAGCRGPGCLGHGGAMGWVGACESMLIRKQGLWCQGPIITSSRAWMNMRQRSWIF